MLRKITLAQAKLAALQEHKLVFISVGTSWCGPCKRMEQEVFTNDSVAEYYNQHFVCVKLDLEHGEGTKIGKRFDIRSVPAYLFLDSADNLVYKMRNAMSASLFLHHAMRANDPFRNLIYYSKNFEEKQHDLQFIEEYLDLLATANMSSPKVVGRYLALQKDSLVSAKNWDIFKQHVKDIYSDEFAFMVRNRKAYGAKTSDIEVTETINYRIEKEFEKIAYKDTFKQADFDKAKACVAALQYEDGDRLIFEAELKAFSSTGKWEQYAALCLDKAEHFYMNQPMELQYLSTIAYNINEHFPPGPLLDKAEFWVKHEVDYQPDYFPCITYANILYKKRNYEEALKQAVRAKEFAKQVGYDETIKISEALIKAIQKQIYSVKK